jgi:predicted ATPase
MLLTGLCGVGKTVLLNELERMALDDGYRTTLVEAHELSLVITSPAELAGRGVTSCTDR